MGQINLEIDYARVRPIKIKIETWVKLMSLTVDRRFLGIDTREIIIDVSGVLWEGSGIYVLRPDNIDLSKISTQSSIRNSP